MLNWPPMVAKFVAQDFEARFRSLKLLLWQRHQPAPDYSEAANALNYFRFRRDSDMARLAAGLPV